ncbi:ADP-ribose pyrophosphatase [Paraliobacillus sp. PM-2]|uniref:NUDIX domain-containing protein n=1 Tax=Paraliobacillus sp. PM-2 TaxID=1462524 RepID=UPI00061C076E|nr:NUDIX hydrolase [Paraliobacillus sp. PM-2]CQR46752.1 ADP-ribose pyrophosphatase [Paraliobacillus sp. PM-2]
MGNKFEEKTISTTQIFNGKIVQLQIDDVTLPDGNTSKREIIKHPGAVAVIAVTDTNKLLMVEQYRKPLNKSIMEIPAGKLEPGEEPVITAKRELEEETGYTTKTLEYVTSFYTTPGFSNELLYVYFTDELTRLEEKKQLDEDEFVAVHEISLSEAEKLLTEQEIHDAKTAYALLYVKERINERG